MNKAIEHQDILENRLEQAHCLLTTLIMAGEAENDHMSPQLMSGALWSVQELVGQATDAFTEMHLLATARLVLCVRGRGAFP